MLQLLIDYFTNLFQGYFSWSDLSMNEMLVRISNGMRYDFNTSQNVYDFIEMSMTEYLAMICSLVSLIIILVLCCLFIYRLIRVVGRLFMGA